MQKNKFSIQSLIQNVQNVGDFLHIEQIQNYNEILKKGGNKKNIEKEIVQEIILSMGFSSQVFHKSNGQPYLENYPDLHLSISHSKGWFAVYVSKNPVGVDIEVNNPNISKGISFFINEVEEQYFNLHTHFQIIWGAKEAFYKLQKGKVGDLKNDVTVIFIDNKFVTLKFNKNKYKLSYFQNKDITLVVS